ncbi:MAG: 5'-nucleotidase [Gammaproteobacteria bacterium]|nr:5'-nucleotidase [Gammaproteobacteria bacterium]
MNAASLPATNPLIVAITARALFALEDSHGLFERQGIQAYTEHQRSREDDVLEHGIAFPLVRKLLALNDGAPPEAPHVEVILLSRNSSDTGLRIFNSIQHHGLAISRATFTSGAPTWPYIKPFGAHLFLSANPDSVRSALEHGVAAATILPAAVGTSTAGQQHRLTERSAHGRAGSGEGLAQIRIAFDGDAVIFGDESERVSQEQGLAAFHDHEITRSGEPLSGGPFRGFLDALHRLQQAFPAGDDAPIRTALVTARSAPAHKRVILTLREWGVRLDEALFLGGRPKGPFLETFGADIFFDDSLHNIDSARQHVAAGHVPHGVGNQ